MAENFPVDGKTFVGMMRNFFADAAGDHHEQVSLDRLQEQFHRHIRLSIEQFRRVLVAWSSCPTLLGRDLQKVGNRAHQQAFERKKNAGTKPLVRVPPFSKVGYVAYTANTIYDLQRDALLEKYPDHQFTRLPLLASDMWTGDSLVEDYKRIIAGREKS